MDSITIYTMQRITDVQADVIVEPVMEQINQAISNFLDTDPVLYTVGF